MARPTKKLTKGQRIALFVQELIRAAPLPYAVVREKVKEKFSITLTDAGMWLGALNERYFVQVPRKKYAPNAKVISLPMHLERAMKMFEELRTEVPIGILMSQKIVRRKNVKRIREVLGRNPQITSDGLTNVTGLNKQTVQDILGQIYAEGFRR